MQRVDRLQATENTHDAVLERILQSMLENDEDITFRALAKKHPGVKAASSITRIECRRTLVEQYQRMQQQFRDWSNRGRKAGKDRLAQLLAERDARVADLERQVETLRASHVAMIRAVAKVGGTTKLLELYDSYRELQNGLKKMNLFPRTEVVSLDSLAGKDRKD